MIQLFRKGVLICLVVFCTCYFFVVKTFAAPTARFWEIQSIDTMKFSRDRSREFIQNSTYAEQKITEQLSAIANTGATHVALGTPYDAEFVPVLELWVRKAREYGLNVWFRGNWSGWEGWFGYPAISRKEHFEKTQSFIRDNAHLFENGDIFTACPECENGGPGDPRMHTDVFSFRKFLLLEHEMLVEEFKNIQKDVQVNINSMNKDVAELVMDQDTTQKVGNRIAIDHYVFEPSALAIDSKKLAERVEANIVVSEFGAPIPDIHRNLTEAEQAAWLDAALSSMLLEPAIIGVNYWTSFDGSTRIWNDDGTPRLAVAILEKYYKPAVVFGKVENELHKPLGSVAIRTKNTLVYTETDGSFVLPFISEDEVATVTISMHDESQFIIVDAKQPNFLVTLSIRDKTWWDRVRIWMYGVLGNDVSRLFASQKTTSHAD